MVKRIELGTSYIVPKGLLGYYMTLLFLIFEEKYIKPFVHFDKHTFYTMCRKDWDWGQTVLQSLIEDLDCFAVELKANAISYECEVLAIYIRRIQEIKNIFAERAVERPIYAYVQV